jgi:hypothetical protein
LLPNAAGGSYVGHENEMKKIKLGKCGIITMLLGGWAVQLACARTFQREIEVLLAPEANSLLIADSILVDAFGPEIIRLFND